jgi:hypothetical protein
VYNYKKGLKRRKNYNIGPIFCTKHPTEDRKKAIESLMLAEEEEPPHMPTPTAAADMITWGSTGA